MDYGKIMLDIFTIFILLTAGTFATLLLIEHRNGEKIRKAVRNLDYELKDETVRDYIDFVDKIQIPHLRTYHDVLKAGYILITEDENINHGLKKEIRKVMLSRGILI